MKSSSDAVGSHLYILKNKIGCDVTFEVGPQKEEVVCHKIFLIARSSVFETMFQDRWTESTATGTSGSTVLSHNSSAIHLPDVGPVVFYNFLQFLYADILSAESIAEVEPLLYLAEKYDVSLLTETCNEILKSKLDVTSVVEIHTIALKYDLSLLASTALEMMAREFSALKLDPSFELIDASVLSSFAASTISIAGDEVDLFNALIKWAEAQCSKTCIEPNGENLRLVLGDILAKIRFPLMTPLEFCKFVVPKNILTSEEKLAIFEYISLDNYSRSKLDGTVKVLQFNRKKRIRLPSPRRCENCGLMSIFRCGDGYHFPRLIPE